MLSPDESIQSKIQRHLLDKDHEKRAGDNSEKAALVVSTPLRSRTEQGIFTDEPESHKKRDDPGERDYQE